MALHHVHRIRKTARLATEDVDDDAGIFAGHVGPPERMEPLGGAAVDQPHGLRVSFNDSAKGANAACVSGSMVNETRHQIVSSAVKWHGGVVSGIIFSRKQ